MSEDIRPSYYGGKNNPFEPIKIIQHYGLCFEISNALKYCLRAGVKNKETEIEDLIKAKTYLQLRIDYLESLKNQNYKKGGEVIQPLKVWDGDNPTKEGSYFKGNLIGKAVFYFEDLRVGCAIQAIDPCFVNGDESKDPTLTAPCFYIVSEIDGNRFMVIDDMKQDHWFRFNWKEKHQFFNISSKKEHHCDVSPKLISELKVGDEIKAVDYLHMDDDTANLALIKDKYYIIKDIIRGTNIIVASEYDKNHYFKLSDLHEYFHVSKE